MDPSSHHHINTAVLVPSAVLLASFLGSGHCVAMCGGLVIAATRSKLGVAFYHLGRLISYSMLGVVFGYMGERMHFMPSKKASYVFAMIMGLGFITLGIINWRDGKMHIPMPQALERWVVKITGKFAAKSAQSKHHLYSGVVGLLSVFLPCGWLYAFALGAMATQSPVKGALFMAVFWLGTVPALVATPLIFQKFLSMTKGLPKISAAALILIGVFTILFKFLPK